MRTLPWTRFLIVQQHAPSSSVTTPWWISKNSSVPLKHFLVFNFLLTGTGSLQWVFWLRVREDYLCCIVNDRRALATVRVHRFGGVSRDDNDEAPVVYEYSALRVFRLARSHRLTSLSPIRPADARGPDFLAIGEATLKRTDSHSARWSWSLQRSAPVSSATGEL